MDSIQDFEDMLSLLNRHQVRHLIVGGLAFVYHAKPRYTKDTDLWIEPTPENLTRTNQALAELGSPKLMSLDNPDEIVQIGVAPDRIDLIQTLGGASFENAWDSRVVDSYGQVQTNGISLDGLLHIQEQIDVPRQQEDARVLREVKRLRDD